MNVPIPPTAETTAIPSALPAHVIEELFNDKTISGGEFINTETVVEQPPASVTVTVYVPGPSPTAVVSVPPFGDQE